MDRQHSAPIWKVILGAAIYSFLTLGLLLSRGIEQAIGAAWEVVFLAIIVGPFVGPYVIWRIVRSTNRRDDPRHQKRPP